MHRQHTVQTGQCAPNALEVGFRGRFSELLLQTAGGDMHIPGMRSEVNTAVSHLYTQMPYKSFAPPLPAQAGYRDTMTPITLRHSAAIT